MLEKIKSVLTRTPPAFPPASSPASTADVVKAQVDLEHKQQRRGTTKAEVERVKAKLEAARVVLAQSERVDADEDSTAVMQRMTRAEEDVRDTEKELTIAIRKDDAALAALKDAERAVKRESLHHLLVQLADVARRVDAQWAGNGKLAAEAVTLFAQISAFGDPEINKKLIDGRLLFRVTLLDTCEAMPGCWTGQDLFKKRLPWSACLPTPDQADRAIK